MEVTWMKNIYQHSSADVPALTFSRSRLLSVRWFRQPVVYPVDLVPLFAARQMIGFMPWLGPNHYTPVIWNTGLFRSLWQEECGFVRQVPAQFASYFVVSVNNTCWIFQTGLAKQQKRVRLDTYRVRCCLYPSLWNRHAVRHVTGLTPVDSECV